MALITPFSGWLQPTGGGDQLQKALPVWVKGDRNDGSREMCGPLIQSHCGNGGNEQVHWDKRAILLLKCWGDRTVCAPKKVLCPSYRDYNCNKNRNKIELTLFTLMYITPWNFAKRLQSIPSIMLCSGVYLTQISASPLCLSIFNTRGALLL